MKIDGTSVTYFTDPESKEFKVCSRNLLRDLPKIFGKSNEHNNSSMSQNLTKLVEQSANLRKISVKSNLISKNFTRNSLTNDQYWDVALNYSLPLTLPEKFPYYAIRGEIYGHGIQDNQLCISVSLLPKLAVFS
ncbi:hypothetical protein HK096_008248, partial [Nowakowskiella sp. JEL0078]